MKIRTGQSTSFKVIALFAILSLALFQAGCTISAKSASTSTDLFDYLGKSKDSAAFGPDKIFGVASITAGSKIHQVGNNGSIGGMFSAISSERDFFDDSQKILDDSIPVILSSLSRTNQYLLLPQQSVLQDQVYAGLESEANSAFDHKNVARGYKRIANNKRLAALARELGLDGVMHVDISYGYSNEGTNIAGVVDYGKNFATVKVNITAVDSEGRVIWQASEASLSSKPVSTSSQVGSAANMKRLEPLLLQSLETSLGMVMNHLES